MRKKKKTTVFAKFKKCIGKFFKKRDSEYSKRLLTKIVNNSLLMMWASYYLAYIGKTEIAETLSKTIASAVIAVVVGYLAKSVIENISKHTTTFGRNIDVPEIPYVPSDNLNIDC